MEPQNSKLHAIVEQALMLYAQASANASQLSESPSGKESPRALSTTVGKQFDRGIKSVDETSPSPQEIHAKVKHLVDTATVFIDRGMNESAFESLMRAYLLDPLAPEVISSEEKILPLLEVMRNRPAQQVTGVHEDSTPLPQSDAVEKGQDDAVSGRSSILKRWRRRR